MKSIAAVRRALLAYKLFIVCFKLLKLLIILILLIIINSY